jgi:DNA-binding NtrC family response regulator
VKILLVEDDEALRQGLEQLLVRAGYEVTGVGDGDQALGLLAGTEVMVTDLNLPGLDGLELIRRAREERGDLEVIVMTAYGSIPTAVEAMRRGARAYLTKPFDAEELLLHLREAEKLVRRLGAVGPGRGELAGGSAAMRRVYHELDVAATADAPVLIVGATGTGKELAVRAIHQASRRAAGPLVALNCGAVPQELFESELFGHAKGAFTGAAGDRRGRFALAHGGILFLDEVDSLPLAIQPKLLRVLETKAFWPVGAEAAERVDVRVIAAASRALEDLVRAGAFREDLFYRLNVLRVAMPSLGERPEDIPAIARALLDRAHGDNRFTLSAAALTRLIARPWPGNVRELANALERACARARHGAAGGGDGPVRLGEEHLDPPVGRVDDQPFKAAKERVIAEWSVRTIRAALAQANGNASAAARRLRMHRIALLRLMKRYDIQV